MDEDNYTYKLTLAYDGKAYHGWQIQPTGITVQELLQKALERILSHPVSVIGAGRTDAGVHALGQVAHFRTEKELDLLKLGKSLNGILPLDIRVLQVDLVPKSFHAQRSAKSKIYHYHLALGRSQNPLRRFYSHHVHHALDQALLRQAAALFVGTHDFRSFANEAHRGSAARNAVRTIYRLDVIEEPGGLRLEFQGTGFLYKMIRNIVGTLIEVSRGYRPLSDIEKLLTLGDRRLAGEAVPPHGLFLVQIEYPE